MLLYDEYKPPFLLEVLLGRATDNPRWQLVQSVASCHQGLSVASHMSQCYIYRLYMGQGKYLFLDWTDGQYTNECEPFWSEKPC